MTFTHSYMYFVLSCALFTGDTNSTKIMVSTLMDIPFSKRDRSVNSFGLFSVLSILIIIGTEVNFFYIAVCMIFLVIYFYQDCQNSEGKTLGLI